MAITPINEGISGQEAANIIFQNDKENEATAMSKLDATAVGVLSYKAGQNIIEKYATGSNTDTEIFNLNQFYDKRNGTIGSSPDFMTSKGLQPVKGGATYEYNFYMYGFAGVCFFDANGVFVFSIAPAANVPPWETLTGSITLPENVAQVGYTFSKNLTSGRSANKFVPQEDLTIATDKIFQLAGVSVLKEEVTEEIDPDGDKKKVTTEEAVISYAPSFDFLGVTFIEAGQNIVDRYRTAPATDAELFSDAMFYDKRNGNKLAGGDFVASRTLQPIKGGLTYDYNFRLYGYAGVCFFDAAGVFVSSIAPVANTGGVWETLTGSIELPENVAQVGYTFSRNTINGRPNSLFSPQSDALLVSEKVFQPAGTVPPPPDLSGYYKKNTGILVSLGDSVTEFGTYPQQLGIELGYTGLRCGVGGTRLSTHVLQYYDQLSFYQIAEAIATGNFTSVNTALDALIAAAQTPDPGKAARLTQTKNNLNNTNFNDVSIITVGFGTNDFTGAKPLGEMSLENEDVNTIVGALNYGCRLLLEAFPHLKIVVVTPTHRYIGTSPTWESSDSYTNGAGLSLIDYVDTLKESAAMRHMPAKDLYREGWFCKENHVTYFSDAVHPRAVGYTQIAKILAGFIKSKIF